MILNNYFLFSIITPIYKTPIKKLKRLYDSLLEQTYSNWEWIIFDDSPEDYKESYNYIKELKEKDNRILLFTENKNFGSVGEVKNKAFMLGNGEILVEVDHDDELINTCLENLLIAYNYSDKIGFVYGNACEIYEDEKNILDYGNYFALGFGKYKEAIYKNKKYKVNITPNVNPKTIRHIVGIPNHVRSWKKEIYHKIGGHDKNLHVADDYELFIRTFLHTKIAKIDAFTYIQYFERNMTNTQFTRNAEIQKLVSKNASKYNKEIHNRFIELGIKDYVWINNNPPTGPGSDYNLNINDPEIEQYANIIIPNNLIINNLFVEENNLQKMNKKDLYAYSKFYNFSFTEDYIQTEHHSNFLKWLIKLTNCQSYLEIGVEYGTNIYEIKDLVKLCVGVDLHNNLNDEKIEYHKIKTDSFFIQNKRTFDIILIDSNHNFKQLKKDFDNSLKILNKYGIIIIHDTDPIVEELLDRRFCDDSYKIIDYISSNKELNIITFPMQETGMTIVMRKNDRRIYNFIESNEKFKIPHIYQDIDGWFDFENIYTDMVNKFPNESLFVEIGTWFGKSASYMAVEIANSEKNIKFDCIDTWRGDIWGINGWEFQKKEQKENINDFLYNIFLKNIEPVKDYLNIIRGWSYDVVNNYKDESIDFLFIDSCHDYESLAKELEDWYPKVKKNGIIAGHDYTHNHPGVIKSVNEFFGENNIQKVIAFNGSGSWIVDKEKFEKNKDKNNEKMKILFYHGYNTFNPNDFLKNGATGAEIATTNISTELTKLGHEVFVITQNSNTNCVYNNVNYASLENIQNILDNNDFDVIVVNRYAHFFNHFTYRTKKLYLWLHDLEILGALGTYWMSEEKVTEIINNNLPEISGIVVGSKWHENHIRNKYPITDKIPFNLISTGLNLSTFPNNIKKQKNRFYWASRPERGLNRLLSLMPKIQEKLPDAELYVSTYVTSEEPEEYECKVSLFEDLKKSIESVKGCYFLGSLPQDELHKQMMMSDIWLYTTDFLETYCAVALEMMYCNVLCIASDLAGLKESVDDRGILFNKDSSDEEIIEILMKAIEKSDDYKNKAYNWVKEQTWENKALEWIKMFKKE